MSVNLTKNKTALLEAWKDVTDDKTSTDWALFGYEKQSNDLYVVEKGDGGLEELIEELSTSKIMYAFCRVICPNSGLPKFVFINWQGEGAPLNRKGACANHVTDVSSFFKGSHVTINARMEEDVEPPLILEKVSKASASTFNFKDRSDPTENMKPVGSVYQRIKPTREINPVEREKFWIKEQEEEKKRLLNEREKLNEERKKLEEETKERELKDSSARDKWVKEQHLSINKKREAERNADNTARNMAEEKMQWEMQLQSDADDEKQRRIRSESLRRERSHEAQSLISKRTINARAIFEQNTAAGQLNSINAPKQSKILQDFEDNMERQEITSPVQEETKSSLQTQFERLQTQSHVERQDDTPQSPVENSRQESRSVAQLQPFTAPKVEIISKEKIETRVDTHNLLKEVSPTRQESEVNAEEEQNWDEPTLEAPPNVKDPLKEMMEEHGIVPPTVDNTQVITSTDAGLKARALYDYQAADETEISFDPDDIITHIQQIDEGWWQGLAPDGTWGLFPANYVELLD